MKFENLDKLFQLYVKSCIQKEPDKYSSHDALEDALGEMFVKFEDTKIDVLDGKTPKEYAKLLQENHELYDYVSWCLENNIEVTDTVLDVVISDDDAVEYLNDLLYEKNDDANMLGVMTLSARGGSDVEDIFIKLLTNTSVKDEIKMVAFEYLMDTDERVVDKILNVINSIPEIEQGILVEVLANYKGRKEVLFWLITMLERGEDVPKFANLLGAYGDESAIDLLKSFAKEFDINYIEYVELRNAVEELGGIMDVEKDFSDDPYYKYMMGISDETSENKDEKIQQ